MKLDEPLLSIVQGLSIGLVCIFVFFSQSIWLNLLGIAVAVVSIYSVMKDR